MLWVLYSVMSGSWLGLGGAPPALRAACRVLAPLAAALLAASVAGIWLMPLRAHVAVLAGMVASIAALARCWAAGIASADGRRELTLLSADLYRRIPEDERPPLLSVVPGP